MNEVLTVSQLVGALDGILEATLPQVEVKGELSDVKVWNQRLVFFELKDEQSNVHCMLPLSQMETPLEDGMAVRIIALPKVTKKGRLSMNVLRLQLAGEGELRRAYELLKQQLEAEGLFSPERKRPLPQFPRKIGLITAAGSAAYQDFHKILNQRWGGLEVYEAHSQVQGDVAVSQLVEAIEQFNHLPDPVDILVMVRGGGSLEDLAAFNTEPLVRAVSRSRSPIVVAVGHESDTSLAELAADRRASTPTAAAHTIVPDREEVRLQVDGKLTYASARIEEQQRRLSQELSRALIRLFRGLRQPAREVEVYRRRLGEELERYERDLQLQSQDITSYQRRLLLRERQVRVKQQARLSSLQRLLQGYNPEAVLKQGYALVRSRGAVIRSIGQLSVGDELVIQLAQGTAIAEVNDVENE